MITKLKERLARVCILTMLLWILLSSILLLPISKKSISDEEKNIILMSASILDERYLCFERNIFSERLNKLISEHKAELANTLTDDQIVRFKCAAVVNNFPLRVLDPLDKKSIYAIRSGVVRLKDIEIRTLTNEQYPEINKCEAQTYRIQVNLREQRYYECASKIPTETSDKIIAQIDDHYFAQFCKDILNYVLLLMLLPFLIFAMILIKIWIPNGFKEKK